LLMRLVAALLHIDLQRDLVAAMDTFHHMLAAGERPTRATFEMLIRGCTLNMTQASSFERAGTIAAHCANDTTLHDA